MEMSWMCQRIQFWRSITVDSVYIGIWRLNVKDYLDILWDSFYAFNQKEDCFMMDLTTLVLCNKEE